MSYIPIYMRPPNKFIRYKIREFDDGAGHSGTVRIAIYKDRKGNIKEEDAQIYWD